MLLVCLLSTVCALADEGRQGDECVSVVTRAVVEGLRRAGPLGGAVEVASEDAGDAESEGGGTAVLSAGGLLQPTPPAWNPQWWRKVRLGGELEYRFAQERPADGPRETARRVALRLECTLEPRDGWELHFALKSGRDGRPTTNWVDPADLGDERWLGLREYYSRQERACGCGELRTQLGRFPYPFELTPLVFDSDFHFTGGLAQYEWRPAAATAPERLRCAVLGAHLREAPEGQAGPAGLVGARLDARWEPSARSRIDAALSYHDFINVDAIGRAVFTGDWRIGGAAGGGETTNYTVGEGDLVSDYNLAGLWVEAHWLEGTRWPVALEVEGAWNTGARGPGTREDCAGYAQLSLGRRGTPGDWQLSVDHARIEADAVLAAVNRGEFASNYKGTRVQTRYCPAAGLEWRLSYAWSANLAPSPSGLAYDNEELRLYATYSW